MITKILGGIVVVAGLAAGWQYLDGHRQTKQAADTFVTAVAPDVQQYRSISGQFNKELAKVQSGSMSLSEFGHDVSAWIPELRNLHDSVASGPITPPLNAAAQSLESSLYDYEDALQEIVAGISTGDVQTSVLENQYMQKSTNTFNESIQELQRLGADTSPLQAN